MPELTASELVATLKRLESLSSRDQRFDDLLLNMNTTLGDMHEHQVSQSQAIMDGLVEAVKNIRFDVPKIEATFTPPAVADDKTSWRSMQVQVTTNMHGQMSGFTITKVD